jgi:hypothetical protein
MHKVGRKVDAAYHDMPDLANDDPREVLCRLGERILEAVLRHSPLNVHCPKHGGASR